MRVAVYVILLLAVIERDEAKHQIVNRHNGGRGAHSASHKPRKFSYMKITDNMKDKFVKAHNLARAAVDPPAADMVALEWDDKVAKMSRKFVRKCKFAHSSSSEREMKGYDYPLGENLFVGMSIAKSHTDPTFVVEKWDEEKMFYDFNTVSCIPGKMCGHYTQVVWSDSRKVGCAIGRCPSVDVRGSTKNRYDILVACHYAPNGNFRGEKPYKLGLFFKKRNMFKYRPRRLQSRKPTASPPPEGFEMIPITESMKKDFIKYHNLARGSVDPPAADMRMLEWDEKIAQVAQKFVKKCEFKHSDAKERTIPGYPYGLGENIFVGMSKYHVKPQYITEKWDEEREFYNFDDMSCLPNKLCGHYTQVVWSTSTKVGCAIAKCPHIKYTSHSMIDLIAVCHYGPPGNWRGQKPYKVGEACSACPADANICYNGFCT